MFDLSLYWFVAECCNVNMHLQGRIVTGTHCDSIWEGWKSHTNSVSGICLGTWAL